MSCTIVVLMYLFDYIAITAFFCNIKQFLRTLLCGTSADFVSPAFSPINPTKLTNFLYVFAVAAPHIIFWRRNASHERVLSELTELLYANEARDEQTGSDDETWFAS